jgi:YidC/Oxa1 family membrane protein insertase
VNDNRNMILAIVLSAVVLIGWSMLSERFLPDRPPPAQQVEDGKAEPAPQPQAGPVEGAPAKMRSRQEVLAESPRVQIRTPSLRGSINLTGARIDDLVLLKERQSMAKDSPPVRLLSPAGAPEAYFASFGWTGEGVQVPTPNARWTASAPVLEPGKPVTLTWSNGDGQTFEIIVSVDENYLFTAQQRVVKRRPGSRRGAALRPHQPRRRIAGPGLLDCACRSDRSVQRCRRYDIDWSTLDDGQVERFDSRGGWLGFSDKYWLTALAPAGNPQIAASFTGTPGGGYQADYAEQPQIVPPGGTVSTETRLFAGAKEKALLDQYEELGIPELSKAIDWGWFEWFMRPIFDVLNWLFEATGNFGVAIICLTVIVRLIMFPIAQKQFKSFAAMRKGPAEAESAPGEVQGRQDQAAAGDAQAVPGREDQPGRRLPSDPPPDPDLLRALQGASGVGRNAPPAVRAVDQGPVGARSADPGQPFRATELHSAGSSSRSGSCRSCSGSRCGSSSS